KLFARRVYYRAKENAPSAQSVNDAIATLESEAIFDGPELDVHLRVAGDTRTIQIDLGDPAWRAIHITGRGWSLLSEHPVRFTRSGGRAALPEPASDGSLELLRPFLNLAEDADWTLLTAWLVSAVRPPGQPYPALVLHGEQGSAKSTTARLLRELIDPSTVP